MDAESGEFRPPDVILWIWVGEVIRRDIPKKMPPTSTLLAQGRFPFGASSICQLRLSAWSVWLWQQALGTFSCAVSRLICWPWTVRFLAKFLTDTRIFEMTALPLSRWKLPLSTWFDWETFTLYYLHCRSTVLTVTVSCLSTVFCKVPPSTLSAVWFWLASVTVSPFTTFGRSLLHKKSLWICHSYDEINGVEEKQSY